MDDTEWQDDGHRIRLELDEVGVRVRLSCPNVTGLCRETPDGNCYLEPFVEDLGLELLAEEYVLQLPVAWRVPDEEPELTIVGPPMEMNGEPDA